MTTLALDFIGYFERVDFEHVVSAFPCNIEYIMVSIILIA